jgi:hypothetical protein
LCSYQKSYLPSGQDERREWRTTEICVRKGETDMNDYKYYSDLDSHPFTGEYNVNFKARIAQNDHVKKFFDGTAGVEQVQNVTPGKIYEVEGYGDVADFYFKDDVGKEQCLADFFFGEVCVE